MSRTLARALNSSVVGLTVPVHTRPTSNEIGMEVAVEEGMRRTVDNMLLGLSDLVGNLGVVYA